MPQNCPLRKGLKRWCKIDAKRSYKQKNQLNSSILWKTYMTSPGTNGLLRNDHKTVREVSTSLVGTSDLLENTRQNGAWSEIRSLGANDTPVKGGQNSASSPIPSRFLLLLPLPGGTRSSWRRRWWDWCTWSSRWGRSRGCWGSSGPPRRWCSWRSSSASSTRWTPRKSPESAHIVHIRESSSASLLARAITTSLIPLRKWLFLFDCKGFHEKKQTKSNGREKRRFFPLGTFQGRPGQVFFFSKLFSSVLHGRVNPRHRSISIF